MIDSEAKALLKRILRAGVHLPDDMHAQAMSLVGVSLFGEKVVFRPNTNRIDVLDQIASHDGPWHLSLTDFYQHDPTMTVALMALMRHGDHLVSVSRPEAMMTLERYAWESVERRVVESGAEIMTWQRET